MPSCLIVVQGSYNRGSKIHIIASYIAEGRGSVVMNEDWAEQSCCCIIIHQSEREGKAEKERGKEGGREIEDAMPINAEKDRGKRKKENERGEGYVGEAKGGGVTNKPQLPRNIQTHQTNVHMLKLPARLRQLWPTHVCSQSG